MEEIPKNLDPKQLPVVDTNIFPGWETSLRPAMPKPMILSNCAKRVINLQTKSEQFICKYYGH